MSASRILRKIASTLASRRLGVVSMLLLAALFALSLVIPQWGHYHDSEYAEILARHGAWLRPADSLGLTNMYRSWPMVIGFVLFIANLWMSFANRLQAVRIETDPRHAKMSGSHDQTSAELQSGADALRVVEGELKARRFKTSLAGGRLAAVRNRFSVLGSLVFHLSFLVLLVALALRMLTYFHGVAVVGVGESFGGQPGSYTAANPKRIAVEDLPEMAFLLQSVEPTYDKNNNLLDVSATIQPHGTEEPPQLVRVNYPYRRGDTSARLVAYGLAPVLKVREPEKRVEHRAAARLIVMPPGTQDTFKFPELFTPLRVTLFPDFDDQLGLLGSMGYNLRNPLALVAFNDVNGEPHEVALRRNVWVEKGGLRFMLEDVIYWAKFEIDRDLGRYPLYFGLILAFIGLCWRMLIPRARVEAWIEEKDGAAVLHLTGKADYTREPFSSEFDRLVESLRPKL